MKTYSLEEITDKHIGKLGTPKREAFENELRLDLLGEAISLGIRPHTDRNIYYQVINEIDTVLLHEKEIFSIMKKRDNSRFKYYFTYTSN